MGLEEPLRLASKEESLGTQALVLDTFFI